jgi:hypothetical protein
LVQQTKNGENGHKMVAKIPKGLQISGNTSLASKFYRILEGLLGKQNIFIRTYTQT